MSPTSSVLSSDDDPSVADSSVRRAFAIYGGVLLGSVAAGTVTLEIGSLEASATMALAGAVAGFVVGTVVTGVLAGRYGDASTLAIGRSRRHRLALFVPAVPFVAAAIPAVFGALEGLPGVVSVAGAIAIAAAGSGVDWLARNRYVDTVTDGEPIATWAWTPPSSGVLDSLLLVLFLGGGAIHALGGDWVLALAWVGIGLFWGLSGVVEGRFRPGDAGETPQLAAYDIGLVKRRPYTRTLLEWDEIDHVRLRDGELVFDRGLRTTRFEPDEFEADDPAAVLETLAGSGLEVSVLERPDASTAD
ncbi:hypothetical protein [Halobiforma nitratireducens]|uniref:Uncharacterized protein n=1 Tax=Halobiforma nitratireducens JCM 10879 TaxID=1227454 RepID=M0ML41_9EURY|nr:hypothetical protein [Halobiforma nitratireducens]EMA45155.1 hypothetical protein C446_02692 [Halobiforma nitratireducens JCM 10879]